MQKEFKIAELDGQVGCFDTLTPLYAAFHEDDKTFSFMWTEYTDDFMAFYQSYLDNPEEVRRQSRRPGSGRADTSRQCLYHFLCSLGVI